MLGVIRRALAFQTVYIAQTYDMDTYVIEAATKDRAKAALFDAGVDPGSVAQVQQAQTALDGDEIAKL